MDYCTLTKDKIFLEELVEQVSDARCGGIASFFGTTRDNFQGKKVESLEYEAHEEMAIKEMFKLCKEIREKWTDVCKIAIVHRLGLVEVKEASIAIVISSPHRKDCLEAVQFAIDKLKATIPIWKKVIINYLHPAFVTYVSTFKESLMPILCLQERYSNGESSWKENAECSWKTK
ncbi:DgyrCDS12124 [Dimorphilus gyrociliatus]|uniref:Molybdopterin synthase catalytic subunit n=1 Tax=Dimorphilus gyrociliatus TaxID=2664684 RepID=A0A7I8W7D7_9ANNE|nr:DgyrCDS12124 [Dimorphilus gyrociliatus]